MSFIILRSRVISFASKRNPRFLCSNATSAPPHSANGPSAASSSRWNFLKYVVVAALTGAIAVTGYTSYGNIDVNVLGTITLTRLLAPLRFAAPLRNFTIEVEGNCCCKGVGCGSEQEEHSLSLSQHSSPFQYDQEQTPGKKTNASVMDSQR